MGKKRYDIESRVPTVAQVPGLDLGDAVHERVQPLVLGAALVGVALARAPAAARELGDVRARVAQAPLQSHTPCGHFHCTRCYIANYLQFVLHLYLRVYYFH